MFLSWVIVLGFVEARACSHFTMSNDCIISARTEDLLGQPIFTIISKPRGSQGLRSSRHGYVAFEDSNIRSGLNDAGLNCDKQTLEVASHPPSSKTLDNIDAAKICQWALEGFTSIEDLKNGLGKVNFVKSKDPAFAYGHWAFRDAAGKGIVLEFTNNSMNIYDDNNDGGETGYGIMTNDPPFPDHLSEVAQLDKQEHAAPSSVRMPGGYSSVARFNRIFLIKSEMPKPKSKQEAIMQAIHILNSVSVPFGSNFFGGYQTQWSVVYDHRNATLYWRSHTNQNMQRVRLADMDLSEGGAEKRILVNSSSLPWFTDASSGFQPKSATTLIL